MKTISVILPCLNEAENLKNLIPTIITNIPNGYDYEIILVDDGSTDQSRLIIEELAKKDKKIKAIFFYHRFGHQAALKAGVGKSNGDLVVMMDSDFQHPPEMIPKFIAKYEEGYDLVQAQKQEDKSTPLLKKIYRRIGYFIWSTISDGILIPGVSDFRLMTKPIAQYLKESNESEIFIRGLVKIPAHNPVTISYTVGKRLHGKSSYNLKMFIKMFVNGFISFSTKPLKTAALFGLALAVTSSAYLLVDIVNSITEGQSIIQGYVTIVLLMMILNGFIIFYLGILGEYIGVIFKEIKHRPVNLVEKTVNF